MEKDELQLVHLARDGDRNAYWSLVKPHLRAVFSTARAILRNSEDAEEVAQESLLKALVNIRQFRAEARFGTWLIQIATNESLQRIRKYRRHLCSPCEKAADDPSFQSREFTDTRELPSEVLARKEHRDALQTAIASLPPKQREVLILHDVAHLNKKEIAESLGLKHECVKTRLWRARLQMRSALAPLFGETWLKRNAHVNRHRAGFRVPERLSN